MLGINLKGKPKENNSETKTFEQINLELKKPEKKVEVNSEKKQQPR